MENQEQPKIAQSHDISIALIQKDIGYIRESFGKIETTIALFNQNFASKNELKALEVIVEKLATDTKKELDKKLDYEDFKPIKNTLYRINWILISSVVVGILALLYNAGE